MEGYLTIKEVAEKYIEGCQTKIQMPTKRLIGKSIMAGMMIAMGAGISSVAAHTIPDVGLARLAAAVVFPVGLMMVILMGAELFTGDCLVAMSVFDGKQKIRNCAKLLLFVYLGNFVGAALTALFISMSGQWDYSSGMLGAYTIKVAIGKVNISGNTVTNDYVVRRELRTYPGDLFSRDAVYRSLREIQQLGYFDPEKIVPDIRPNPESGTVDIDYQLVEKSS